MKPEELVARLKAYADIENTATDRAQQESLARAADLVALYQSMAWVPEMDEHHPVGKRQFGSGPQHDPQSFARFTRWLVQVRGVDLKSARQYQLRAAHDLIQEFRLYGVETKPRTEWEVRPFLKLKKQGYGEQIPTLWAKATEYGPADSGRVREVIAEFRKGWTAGARRQATAAEKLSARRSHAMLGLERLWELDPQEAIALVNKWAERHGLTDMDAVA